MRGITDICDQAACFLIDPLNSRFSSDTQRMACALTLLFGILTLGMAQAMSVLWRTLRPIEEENETHALITAQFRKIFYANEFQEIQYDKAEPLLEEKMDRIVEKEEPAEEKTLEEKFFEEEETSDKFLDSHLFEKFFSSEPSSSEDDNSPFEDIIITQPAVDMTSEKEEKPVMADPLPLKFQEPAPAEPPSILVIEEVQPDIFQQQFSFAELLTIRAGLLNFERVIDLEGGKKYVIKYDPQSSGLIIHDWAFGFRMFQNTKFEIFIDQKGKITSLRINQQIKHDSPKTIPNESANLLHACLKWFLEQIYRETSAYSLTFHYFTIRVVRGGIKQIPEFHLQQLTQLLEEGLKEQGFDLNMSLRFKNENLEEDAGIDTGGLSRDFLDDLFEGIIRNSTLSFKPIGGSALVLPHSKISCDSSQLTPLLDERERTLYRDIGKVISYCYHSQSQMNKKYVIGLRFDEALFNAALCLTAEEVDADFEKMTLQTKLKMCRALLTVRNDKGMDLNYLKNRIDWLDAFDVLDPQQLSEAALSVHYGGFLPNHLTVNSLGDDPDLNLIDQKREEFKQALIASIFIQKGAHGQFGAQLAPIHAIAQGMKSLCRINNRPILNDNSHWENIFRPIGYQMFSDLVQGSFDRQMIADLLKSIFAPAEIQKKNGWLKEWILDVEKGATEEDLRNLLKFLTGSSSILKGIQIDVSSQHGTFYPVPVVHTCSFRMELAPDPCNYGADYNDHTKENFIRSLKELALKNPSTYQMG